MNDIGALALFRLSVLGPLVSREQLVRGELQLRISAIVDAWNRLIVDGETASPERRWGSAQALGWTVA